MSRSTVLGISVFFAFLGVVFFLNTLSPDEPSVNRFDPAVVNSILEKHKTTFDPITLNIAIEVAIGDDNDIGQWQLNKTYEADKLNILIIDTEGGRWGEELEPWYETLRRNAVYIRELTTIIVDYQLIEYLSHRYYENLDPYDWGTRGYFVQWIVAHEIGHHKSKHETAHFTDNAILGFNGLLRNRRHMEIEADTHLANTIIRNESTDLGANANYLDAYVLVLFDMLKKELSIQEESRTQISYWRIVLDRLGIMSRHPQYIERALLLLDLLSEASDDEELKAWVKENRSAF